jgi:hypothetical protein
MRRTTLKPTPEDASVTDTLNDRAELRHDRLNTRCKQFDLLDVVGGDQIAEVGAICQP